MMIPKTKKLFISYRSSDHREVDYIAEKLRSVKHDDDTVKYKTWQDKYDLKGGKSWWDGIVDAIIDCDIFVFHLAPEYLASKVCIAELDYAIERGRPIIPVVLDTAYYVNPRTKKPDIDFWDDVPEWLGKYQFIFYHEDDFLSRFDDAVAEYELAWSRDIPARRPLNPDADSLHGSSYEVYATATDYAQKVAFDDAKPLFRELVQRNDEDFAEICRQWLTIMNHYQDLLDARKHRAPRAVFRRKWEAYAALFPVDFIDDLYPDIEEHPIIFDPNNLAKQRRQPKRKTRVEAKYVPPSTAKTSQPLATRPALTTTTKPSSNSLMPKPFDWIEIPNKDYIIAKYPITNAQFRKFIEVGGYTTDKWWTKEGLKYRNDKNWTEPRYWTDSKWNGDNQPVVGVSWFEAVAFCLWLSETTGEKIMLPTEDQWQFAAQGDDGRKYPWGNDWNRDLCNNNVDKKGIGKTTPVTQYEGKGDSPFGVVDMAGNVWEWCLTDYENKTNDVESSANKRVVRGGSWFNDDSVFFRAVNRNRYGPYDGFLNYGFRISRFN